MSTVIIAIPSAKGRCISSINELETTLPADGDVSVCISPVIKETTFCYILSLSLSPPFGGRWRRSFGRKTKEGGYLSSDSEKTPRLSAPLGKIWDTDTKVCR